VIAYVLSAGESLTANIATSQNSSPVQDHLTPQSNQRPYLGRLAEFAEEMSVLLVNRCSDHVTDDVITFLTDARVRIITCALHTPQVFQILHRTFFGVLKRCLRDELPFCDENTTVEFIMKVSHDFGQTLSSPNIWGACRALEVDSDATNCPYRLFFKEEKLRESACFPELWFIDVALDWLSSRRWPSRFIWIDTLE
jgi:hypothetical protein